MRRHHVSAGSFYTGPSQPVILESFLGTCVGVALIDPEAGVGGLSHFLLPHPVSTTSAAHPEKYASSGLPLFLKAVYDAGGRRGHLKAFMAGGALVGPVAHLDLDLNIGGRITQTVEELLAEEKIPVVNTETGGFFSCCISLNMQDWTCRIEPAGVERPRGSLFSAMPTPAEIERVIEDLRPVPQVALKILHMMEEEEYDIRKLTREIRKDQVISARTLQLANSVMFATHNRIESLDHALMHLGLNILIKFVIAAAIDGFFSKTEAGYSLCKGGLYHHAVGAAVVSEMLAKHTGAARPGLSYTAALLHDIGKVVLDQYVDAAFPLLYRKLSRRQAVDFTLEEQTLFEIDHTEVGYRLAQRWGFPESLAEAIRFHHQPEKATQYRELTHIVHLADLLVSQFRPGLELEQLNTENLTSRLAAVNLSPQQFAEIVDMLPASLFSENPDSILVA